MKKLISALLALLLLGSIIPAAIAQEATGGGETPKLVITEPDKSTSGTCGDNAKWSIDTQTGVLTISGSGPMTSWNNSNGAPWLSYWRNTVRSVKISEGITSIGGYAFYGCKNLTSVSLPSTVETMGYNVFCNCSAITSLALPAKLKSVGSSCFRGCTALKALELPAALTSVGYSAFSECPALKLTVQNGNPAFRTSGSAILTADGKSLLWLRDPAVKNATVPAGVDTVEHDAFKGDTYLQSITIPEGVKRLAYSAFDGCSAMKTISLPASVTAFFTSDYYSPVSKTTPFRGCSALEKVTVAAGNSAFCSVDGVLMNSAKTELLCYPEGRKGSWTVPATIRMYNCILANHPNLTGITFEEGIKEIPQQALDNCPNVAYVNIPSSVISIRSHAFRGCTALTQIDLSRTQITSVPASCFENCSSLQNVKLPKSVNRIGERAFYGCKVLSGMELPDVELIDSYAFGECRALKELRLPATLCELGSGAFFGAGLTEFRAPEQLTKIGNGLLEGCTNLVSAELPDTLTELPPLTFSLCRSLKNVTLPRNLVTIGEACFAGSGIEDLLIPASVRKISDEITVWDHCFEGCKNLKSLHFLGNAPEGTLSVFTGCSNDITLYYPEGASGWNSTKLTGKLYSPDVTVTAKPCKYTYFATVGCTENGKESWTCSHCGKTWAKQTEALGHTFGEWLEDENNDSRWKRVCIRCGETVYVPIPKVDTGLTEAAASTNANAQTYTTWAKTVKSYLYEENDRLVRVEAMSGGVDVEFYDSGCNVTRRCLLPMELPIFGGFYAGEKYNFLVLGQNNKAESYDTEVIRVIRYTKDFRRCGSVSVYGANTVYPFDAGSLRMTEAGNMLYIATSHEMFAASDGVNHQANLLLAVDTEALALTDCLDQITNSFYGYVSHSFNQFILTDGDRLVQLNQGDAYPRGTILQAFPAKAGSPTFGTKNTQMRYVDVFPYGGSSSNNATGAELGGLEASGSCYLVAGSANRDKELSSTAQRNIFVTATQKKALDGTGYTTGSDGKVTGAHTSVVWLTDHAAGSGVKVSAPQLVKLTNDRFCVLWTENDTLCWYYLDGNGKLLSDSYRQENVRLSDCKPVVADGAIVWYYTENSTPVFCTVRDGVCTRIRTDGRLFTDVPKGRWFYDCVKYVAENGIMAGTGNDEFSPFTTASRAMLATVLYRMAGEPAVKSTAAFSDVINGSWYADAVSWASETGVMVGIGDGKFGTNDPVTREQLAQILYRYAGSGTPITATLASFADGNAVHAWAKDGVRWAVQEGLLSGRQEGATVLLAPQGELTRAELASVLTRLLKTE